MVTKESLQNYADTIFAGLSLEAPKSELNLSRGGYNLTVSANGASHLRWFDENLVNSDMEARVRALRDELFPPVEASEVKDAEPVEPAPETPAEPPAPATDPAPPPVIEDKSDPFPAEETKPDKKASASER